MRARSRSQLDNMRERCIDASNLKHLDRHHAIDWRAIRAAVREEIKLVDVARQHGDVRQPSRLRLLIDELFLYSTRDCCEQNSTNTTHTHTHTHIHLRSTVGYREYRRLWIFLGEEERQRSPTATEIQNTHAILQRGALAIQLEHVVLGLVERRRCCREVARTILQTFAQTQLREHLCDTHNQPTAYK
jgi:hypothetical protein